MQTGAQNAWNRSARRRRFVAAATALSLAAMTGPLEVPAADGLVAVRGCYETVDGECRLPTPTDCALDLAAAGEWQGPVDSMIAGCFGGGDGHVRHYYGGNTERCATRIVDDQIESIGFWSDPNKCAPTARNPGSSPAGRFLPEVVSGRGGAVASNSAAASAVGIAILEAGGNAMDAAVATVFAYSVTRPAMCGIGGGGFLVYRGADGEVAALDFRETAPAAMTPEHHGVMAQGGETGYLTVGVPGVVAGMVAAMEKYGTLGLPAVIEPAREMAAAGIPVSIGLANDYTSATPRNDVRLRTDPAAAAVYLREDGRQHAPDNPLVGSRIIQEDYATSLAAIAAEGRRAFYEGDLAQKIVAAMEASQLRAEPSDRGIMTIEDLRGYKAVWRTPLIGTYRGVQVIAMPPPASGGIVTIEVLNLLEHVGLGTSIPHSSVEHIHYVAEAQKLAWADRSRHVADPDRWDVPTAELTSKVYAAERFHDDIQGEDGGAKAREYQPGTFDGEPAASSDQAGDPGHTGHISVIDRRGNAVSVTCSLGSGYGSARMAPGTGFMLNNELLDFDPPGTANQPEGGKRPRSSMDPVIVVDGNRPILVTGAAGATFIPMGVTQSIINVVDFGMDIAGAIDAPRWQSWSKGDGLHLEHGRIAPEVIEGLRAREHTVKPPAGGGEYSFLPQVESVGTSTTRERLAVSDPRGESGAAALAIRASR